jgi:hypothetical protein
MALGQVFSEYFGFPCQLSFQRMFHTHHHLSSGTGTTGQTVAAVQTGFSLIQPQETKPRMKLLHTPTFWFLWNTQRYFRLLVCHRSRLSRALAPKIQPSRIWSGPVGFVEGQLGRCATSNFRSRYVSKVVLET